MASVFEVVKEQIPILEAVERYTGLATIPEGEDRFQMEDKACPSCGHNDCFKIYPKDNSWCCYSEDVGGDVTSFVSLIKRMTMYEAAIDLLGKFDIPVPKGENTIQKIFNTAANYYHQNFLENTAASVKGMTPTEYQTSFRKFDRDTLEYFAVGYTDGGLCNFLRSLDHTDEEIIESGLGKVSNQTGKVYDFFSKKLFIYPHFDSRGRVCHFTIKDPEKVKKYQLPNKYVLNGIMFYGPTYLAKFENVIITEGETDKLAIWQQLKNFSPRGMTIDNTAVLACIGMVSGEQLRWIGEHCKDKNVLTFFDNDDAGNKYRKKFHSVSKPFKSIHHYSTESVGKKDIDEFIKDGGTFEQALSTLEITVGEEEDVIDVSSANAKGKSGIIEKDRCYYKFRMNKEGDVTPVMITNFVIQLLNIYVTNGVKEREVVFIRHDGKRSAPTLISSTEKVNTRAFKESIANVIDGSFYGTEEDLTSIWDYVYEVNKEREVLVTKTVGKVQIGEVSAWLFANKLIAQGGAEYAPDNSGVFWITSNSSGIATDGIEERSDRSRDVSRIMKDVPALKWDMPREQTEDLLGIYLTNLATNLGNPGIALTMTAWSWANAYSDFLFYRSSVGFFPFMMLWGPFGKGKTNLIKWNLGFYGMENRGYTTMPQLRSGVGFERKAAYYGSMPLGVDEIRNDKDMDEHMAKFRGWFNRTGRAMGSKDSGRVVSQAIVANFIFAGQDVFNDHAARERCLALEVPHKGRETVHSYEVLDRMAREGLLTAIGAMWIKDSLDVDMEGLQDEIKIAKNFLVKLGASLRLADIWSIIIPFAVRLRDQYFPQYEYMEYVATNTRETVEDMTEDSMAMQFLATIEGILAGKDFDKITGEHIFVDEDDKLYMWFPEVYRIVVGASVGKIRDSFSRLAIKAEMKNLECFEIEGKAAFGIRQKQQRCLIFDLNKPHPDSLANIKLALAG